MATYLISLQSLIINNAIDAVHPKYTIFTVFLVLAAKKHARIAAIAS